MSAVWDRAMEVIAGRWSILASIVLLFVWLPNVLVTGLRFALFGVAAADPNTVGPPWLSLLSLVVAAVGALGYLALIAVASDPAASRDDAVAVALRRFLPYLGVALPLLALIALLIVPLAMAVVSGYPSMAAMRAGGPPALSAGVSLFAVLYGTALLIALLWLQARVLVVLAPVVVNERLGLRAYARAVALTRGLAWRVIGVLLLFGLVAGVVVLATREVVGIALRLLFGEAGMVTALFLTRATVSLVAAGLAVVAATFIAQLYLAARA